MAALVTDVVFTAIVVVVVASQASPVVIAVATIVWIPSCIASGGGVVAASESSRMGSRVESLHDSKKTANTTAPNKAPGVVRRLQLCPADMAGWLGLRGELVKAAILSLVTHDVTVISATYPPKPNRRPVVNAIPACHNIDNDVEVQDVHPCILQATLQATTTDDDALAATVLPRLGRR
ncbi:hypothetical protein EDB84DRAFT_1676148 [Lactarius hengduanensis]|nr:hypothetical protein EDB84DRAFT_1676148 [Lactarius hengduanensis]